MLLTVVNGFPRQPITKGPHIVVQLLTHSARIWDIM